jgi:hypothetical protein
MTREASFLCAEGPFRLEALRSISKHSNETLLALRPAPKLEDHHLSAESDHSTPSGAEVKNVWGYTSTPPYVCMTSFSSR